MGGCVGAIAGAIVGAGLTDPGVVFRFPGQTFFTGWDFC